MNNSPPRVRIAPAPSGHLHVGNVRTALYNWLHARQQGGTFVLRIEDTDRTRATDESMHALLGAFRWLGLDWDEGPEVGGPHGPYRQSERTALYGAVARRLDAAGHAYRDYRTPDEVEAFRAERRASKRPPIVKASNAAAAPADRTAFDAEGRPFALRLATPEDGAIEVDDLVRGTVRWDWAAVGDPVLVRSDGSATYPLANTVDDVAQGIALVCRGEDLLSATPFQAYLYGLLLADDLLDAALDEVGLPPREAGWGPPSGFAHLSMIVGPDRQKLSKRHGPVSIQEFARQGFLPETLINYLALLGWAPGDGRERMDLDEMVAAFSFDRVGKAAAAFDFGKLTAFNGERIRDLPSEELARRLVPYLDGTYGEALVASPPTGDERALLEGLVPLVAERMQRLDEVSRYAPCFFRDEVELDADSVEKVLAKEGAGRALDAATKALESLHRWEADAIEEALRSLPEQLGMGAKKVFQPVRVAVTGSSVSPPLFESVALIARERALGRLRAARRLASD